MNMLARLQGSPHRPAAGTIFGVLLATGALGFGSIGGTAQADTCLEKVHRLAGRHGLTVDPPDASLGDRSTEIDSQDLARSGGVIEPPPSGDHPVIEPPETLDDDMRTLPGATPSGSAGAGLGSNSLNASDRMLAESILMSARDEAEQGDDISCFKRLHEARGILQP